MTSILLTEQCSVNSLTLNYIPIVAYSILHVEYCQYVLFFTVINGDERWGFKLVTRIQQNNRTCQHPEHVQLLLNGTIYPWMRWANCVYM